MPIDPPITFRPTSLGHDPEPMGSDRFATLVARAAGEALTPPRRARRFERRAGEPGHAPQPASPGLQ